MSESDGDFSDELLELAGAGDSPEKKRKKRQDFSSKSSKRRKPDADTGDEGPGSGEGQDSNPYPLEGKYVDEADRQKLLSMPEIEREGILEQRLEEMQRFQDARNLDQMVKAQKGGEAEASKMPKRSQAARGWNKEKSRKLDEYRAKRLAKGDKIKNKTNSPKRERSSSPMEMETESEEEEDGQISKFEEQEERERQLYGQPTAVNETLTCEDMCKCQITRTMLAKHYAAPWFADFCKGAWVRYCIGVDKGQSVYRICEIVGLVDAPKVYKVDEQNLNQNFILKHGDSSREWPMDRTSNSAFEAGEFERLTKAAENDKVKLPTKKELIKKAEEMTKLSTAIITESDISAMLARKQMMSSKQSAASVRIQKSRLTQARTLAFRRQDMSEVRSIDVQLAELNAANPEMEREDAATDVMAKVNERNRKANLEATRKAEQMEAERRKRERKLAAAARASNSPVPSALAALKIGTPRPMTPSLNDITPELATASSSAVPGSTDSFEASIADVEIDLGDF
ncbi:plus-3-domain-containing protein [Thelephora terrestris]|uniref:Plus-3-domain-containing protein n=1 Tax=Thelephora terrestris TaxID=56493 RepID=A0A9P6L3Y2_9AGAM|nr:plus-3-domain-containing protein [Thelephora terrestris]